MGKIDDAIATQLANIEKRTGKSLKELATIVAKSGLTKHGEIRDMLKRELAMGHGDANTLVHHVLNSRGQPAVVAGEKSIEDIVAEFYAGPKAPLKPIHDLIMKHVHKFGEFEIAPKKTYLSLRRKKQFAMIGPATNTRIEIGLNMKDVEATERLVLMPPKGMCDYKVKVSDVKEVDKELIAWIRRAFDSAAS